MNTLTLPRCGDIGEPLREGECEPLTLPAVPEPVTAPATPEPVKEPAHV